MAYPKITLSIEVTKVKKHLFRTDSKNRLWLDVALFEKPGKYDDGFLTQSISKALREAGEKGEILGNWKHCAQDAKTSPPPTSPPPQAPDSGDRVPF